MIRVALLALWATAAFAEAPRHVYRVKRGQGVDEVALRTGVTVKELRSMNGNGELREAKLTGEFYPDADELTYSITFDDYGTKKDIQAP